MADIDSFPCVVVIRETGDVVGGPFATPPELYRFFRKSACREDLHDFLRCYSIEMVYPIEVRMSVSP